MNRWLLISLLLTFAVGCDDDDASANAGDAGADPSCPLSCSGHGRCVLVGGLPSCACDAGFEAQGLDCVDPEANPSAPTGFSCPAPGDLSGPGATRLVSQGWSYKMNDRTCASERGGDVYHFNEDGLFTRHHQAFDATSSSGGTFIYGCWSLTGEVDGVLSLSFDHAEENRWQYNCGVIAGLMDPPCAGELKYEEARGGFVAQRQLDYEEVHVLSPAPAECVWCEDVVGCCPDGWVEADGQPLCP